MQDPSQNLKKQQCAKGHATSQHAAMTSTALSMDHVPSSDRSCNATSSPFHRKTFARGPFLRFAVLPSSLPSFPMHYTHPLAFLPSKYLPRMPPACSEAGRGPLGSLE